MLHYSSTGSQYNQYRDMIQNSKGYGMVTVILVLIRGELHLLPIVV